MKVTKMHGIGNDYVYVDGFHEIVKDPPRFARLVSDRHFGVGGDGLIIIRPPSSAGADCRMEMYNADGSRAQMCGNGIRCVAKFVHDRALVDGDTVRVESDAGIRVVEVLGDNGVSGATLVRVGMGAPDFRPASLPACVPGAKGGGDADERAVDPALEPILDLLGIGPVRVTLVSMGNPHCVVRLGDGQPTGLAGSLADLPLETIGPVFESHRAFPERVNTEFVHVITSGEIDLRVWERGSGETLACGTGACAAMAAGVVGGWLDREVSVHLLGGDLRIRWDEATGEIFMTGPAVEVFTADLQPSWLESGGPEIR